MDFTDLTNDILEIIKDDNFDINDLKNILDPIFDFTNNTIFTSNIQEIISILIQDRDGNTVFSINDLSLISKDLTAITSLISCILLTLGSITNLKINLTDQRIEQLLFKLLIYIFIVIIPKQMGNSWSYKDKKQILTLILSIYEIIRSSGITKDIITKIIEWFKQINLCSCASKQEQASVILETRMPKLALKLRYSIDNIRDKGQMMTEIKELKKKLEKNINKENKKKK